MGRKRRKIGRAGVNPEVERLRKAAAKRREKRKINEAAEALNVSKNRILVAKKTKEVLEKAKTVHLHNDPKAQLRLFENLCEAMPFLSTLQEEELEELEIEIEKNIVVRVGGRIIRTMLKIGAIKEARKIADKLRTDDKENGYVIELLMLCYDFKSFVVSMNLEQLAHLKNHLVDTCQEQ
jgi:hypothetical protein